MSYMMLHGLGDCTPERHCGCLGQSQERTRTMSDEPCTCPPWHPGTDGPAEDCAQHGRPYGYWVEYAGVLERWKEEALPVIDGLQELGRALGTPLGSRITGPEALDRLTALLAEARAEAWDEGKHSEPACWAGDFPGECPCENPYRKERTNE